MYSNIGTKCKSLAKIVGVGGAVLSSLGFFVTLIVGLANGNFESVAVLIVTFLILTPGCIIASFPLYCVGDTNEKICLLAERKGTPSTEAPVYAATASNDLPEL
jgi:hypothetical protein